MLVALRRCTGITTRRVVNASSPSILDTAFLRSATFLNASRAAPLALRQFHQIRSLQQSAAVAQEAQDHDQAESSALPPAEIVTEFQELAERKLVDDVIVENITRGLGLKTMTEVQTATINEALKGSDIIAQAKTGTGKTIAFLLPILQRIIMEDPSLSGRTYRTTRTTAEDIRAIIISPTRELAEQIAAEASKILRNTKIVVQTAVGGTMKNQMLSRTRSMGCHVLVGTPGRLKDILSDPQSGVKAPALDALVLDEADRLLDQGFWHEVQEIMQLLPDTQVKDRQTMMFSATIPREVIGAVRETLKPGYKFVKCVRDDEQPTHERIEQKLVHALSFENVTPAIFELCQREIERAAETGGKPFKAMVFFNSTADVAMATAVFQGARHRLNPARIIEIHSKLTQQQRTRAADEFRRASSAIMFTSDVTARGMDFPNVTHVIQVGIPMTPETYTHRIGRTGRAGKEGQGWLIMSKMELPEARHRLSQFPLKKDESLQCASIDMTQAATLPTKVATVLTEVGNAYKQVPPELMANSYRAQLGVFQWLRNKQQLVDAMNRLSRFGWGLAQPPAIASGLAQKLGLSRIEGVRISNRSLDSGPGSGFSRGRGGPRGGGGDQFDFLPGRGSSGRSSRSPPTRTNAFA